MSAEEIINSLLKLAVENEASDIHIKSDKPGILRLNGILQEVDMEPISAAEARDFITETVPYKFKDDWEHDGQIDYSYSIKGIGRFRVNGFFQRGTVSVVFRHVKDQAPTFDELNISNGEVLENLCQLKDGVVLICGATGSGKSSTLASMMNWINNNLNRHVVTLEDPIEFNFDDRKSVFNQREIGIDAPSFSHGMRAVLRQDPDIILIGEMRDKTTFETALSAAETGHLVLSTLHSSGSQQAVQRVFEFFPPEQQVIMRRQIAGSLKAICTQRLIPSLEGDRRYPAIETFVIDSLGKSVIQEGQFEKIPAVVEAGKENGSNTFNQSLYELVQGGLISKTDALKFSPNPKALEMNLKGIFLSSGGIVS
ncbi:MAG: PilT/PilU family type 4a pilus ATPase [Opitutales bacterium]|nr:PilT/PilU family type 4a pilus ATPase [Opitutales bacterium]MDG2167381.1 PilT/PilU family type 4a pilus ATPase [Opitutales bacterium]